MKTTSLLLIVPLLSGCLFCGCSEPQPSLGDRITKAKLKVELLEKDVKQTRDSLKLSKTLIRMKERDLDELDNAKNRKELKDAIEHYDFFLDILKKDTERLEAAQAELIKISL
jgi:outer membrane murein-binding lipoprotein Lpp